MTEEELDIIFKILHLSKQPWFSNGDDCTEDLIEDPILYEGNDVIENAITWASGGPGYTDVWIKEGELISDITPDVESEEEREEFYAQIGEDNRESFKEKRAKSIVELLEILPGLFKVPGVKPSRMYEIIKEKREA
jgi:hypothetical protein